MDEAHKASNIAFGAIGDVRGGDGTSEQLWSADHDALAKKIEAEKQGILRMRHGSYQQSNVDFYRSTHSLASSSPSSYRPVISPPPATHLFHPSSRQFSPFDVNSQFQSTVNTSRPLRQEQHSHHHQQQQQLHHQQTHLQRNNQQRNSGQNDQYQTAIHSQPSSQPHMNHSFPLPIHSQDTSTALRRSAAELMPWYHPVSQQSQARAVQDEQQSAGLLAQGAFPPAQLFDMGLASSTLEPHSSLQSLTNSSNQPKKRATNLNRRVSQPNVNAQSTPASTRNTAVRLANAPAIRKKLTIGAQKHIVQKNLTKPTSKLPSSNVPNQRRVSSPQTQARHISQSVPIARSTNATNSTKSALSVGAVSRGSTGANLSPGGTITQTGNAQTVVGTQKIYTKNGRGVDSNKVNQATRKRRHIETVASRPVNSAVGRIACEYCGQMFDMKRTRDIHVRSYHERSFPCEKCPSLFKTKSDANRHMRIVHERVRPFSCTQCSSTFAEKSKLARHVKTVHEKLRPHVCPICQAQFGEKGNLAQHKNARHGHRSSSSS